MIQCLNANDVHRLYTDTISPSGLCNINYLTKPESKL